MGIRVAWTIEWQKQKQKQKFQTTPTPCGSGLARDGSTMFLQIERGACIAGKPGSHREKMSVANPASKQAGRSAASTAFDLPAPSGGRTARHLKETQPTESAAFRPPASEVCGYC
jgi:hypothetical protein